MRGGGRGDTPALDQIFTQCQRNFAFGAFDWGSLEEESHGDGDADWSPDISEPFETKNDPWRTSFGRAPVLMDADAMGTVFEQVDVTIDEVPTEAHFHDDEAEAEVDDAVEDSIQAELEEAEVEAEAASRLLESTLDEADQAMEDEAEALAEAEMVASGRSLQFQASFRSHQSDRADHAVLTAFLEVDEVEDDLDGNA